MRVEQGGHVIVFVFKPKEDETIVRSYLGKGYVRWKTWKKNPSIHEDKVLLWPDVKKAKGDPAIIKAIQRSVFFPAVHKLIDGGRRTVHIDEALYMCHPSFLGMADELAMMHSIGRSGYLTMVDLMQRPSHLPLIIYGSASHAFIGRTRKRADAQRMGELGSREGGKKLAAMVGDQGLHDFIWAPIAADWPAERFNLCA